MLNDLKLCKRHVINEWNDTSQSIHNKLILTYINDLVKYYSKDKNDDLSSRERIDFNSLRSEFFHFLKLSQYYVPQKIIPSIPTEGFIMERAYLYSRMYKLKDAVRIYLFEISSLEHTEGFCKDYFCEEMKRTAIPSNACLAYYEFILACFSETHEKFTDNTFVQTGLRLYIEHYKYLSPQQHQSIIQVIPNDILLSEIFRPLCLLLKSSYQNLAKKSIIKSLIESKFHKDINLRLRSVSRSFKVEDRTICSECNKKIGLSTFIITNTRTMAHLSCGKDKYNMSHIP